MLTDGENTVKTYHEKNMIAKVREVDEAAISNCFNSLSGFLDQVTEEAVLVPKMKEFVPGFVSNNSVFEDLDQTRVVAMC